MMYIFAQLLLAASIVMAQSPTLTEGPAPTIVVGSPNPTATLSISVSTSQVSSCDAMDILWSVENETAAADSAVLTLFYSNLGVDQVDNSTGHVYNPHSTQNLIAQQQVSKGTFHWNPVWLNDPGFYVITATTDSDPSEGDPTILVRKSQPFLLTVQNTSCLSQATSNTLSSTPSISDLPPASSTDSSTPSETAVIANAPKPSKIGPIVGGTLAGCAALGLLMSLLICRRRRQVIAKNATPRTIAGKAHNRTWGGLSSIDKLQGEIPVVVPAESPYAYRRRSQSTGRAMTMTTEEDGEKGHKDGFPVDADLLAEMPTLAQTKSTRRYSSDALSNVLRQKGGSDKHARNMVPAPAAPVLSTTTATSGGGDDPFSDAAFIAHGKRMSALSVPSTARSPSRVSEVAAPSPSPIPPATPIASQPSTIARNASANASIGRPSRKPVPQYDDEFELTKPNKSSPTSLQPPANYSRPGSSRGDLSSSATSHSNALASSVESSSTNWLHAPMANRNIGLAGQNEGSTVHYLIPDMPPPPRD